MTSDLHGELRDPPPPLATPARALAIGAHPDDIEFGAGGTLARWASLGCEVTLVVVTDGSKGTWDPAVNPSALAAIRRDEQAAAALALGAVGVVHLDHVDGELEYSMALREQICGEIRRARPDVLLGHDPWQRYQLHPDHRAAGLAVVDGVVAARDPLFFPDQGLAPHRPSALLLWSADQPDHAEPIATTIETKIEALLCHSSQGTTTMGGAETGDALRREFVSRMRNRATTEGVTVGLEMAERFKRLTP
jgi:LmbE family N-acetylglucosaminyl deacetylase